MTKQCSNTPPPQPSEQPAQPSALIQQALAFHRAGQLEEAKQHYLQILEIAPQNAPSLGLLGTVFLQQNCCKEAIFYLEKSLIINPNEPDILCNYAIALRQVNRLDDAIASYDKAITLNPNNAGAHYNKGISLELLKRNQEAIESYEKAIAINPNHVNAYDNRGNVLRELKRFKEALASHDRAIAINPHHAIAWNNRGSVLQELKRWNEAFESYDQAIALQLDAPWLYGSRFHAKSHICNWKNFDVEVQKLGEKIIESEKTSANFAFLTITFSTSLTLQRTVAAIWVNDKYPLNSKLGIIPHRSTSHKIRIGYFSSDFRGNHPVANVIAELFELHDKNRFEIIAFSFGSDTNDSLRQRIRNSFDKFIDVNNYSDEEVAQLARSMDIDIAVDLNGFTADNRFGIFSYRAAPIQACYLGYPGTVGADYMDYVIADPIVIPAESQIHYSGKIAYLPDCYQVNDRKRKISDRIFTREELGLPESGFVFCCFNNNYKITPHTFDSWMKILHQVPDSVLWLVKDNATAAENLLKEAQARRIDAKRIIFAQRVPLTEDYLARNRMADLFLDTLPYNAHSTASDALWAGLPILTRMGESFASRVAGSLLNAIGLPELITTTAEEFEAKAVELALNPEKLQAIREKLHRNRLTTPLFDTPLFTRNLENAYEQMMQRYHAGLPPDHLS